MIKTTYVRLEKAAEMLDTDIDTLLIAASAGEIQLFSLFGSFVTAQLVRVDGQLSTDQNSQSVLSEPCDKFFDYVVVQRQTAAALLQGCLAFTFQLTELDEESRYWKYISDNHGSEGVFVRKFHLFLKRAYIEEQLVTSSKKPDGKKLRTSDAEPRRSSEVRMRNTLLAIMAALADQAGVDPGERGAAARIARWTEHFGAPVGEDTVKKYLDLIPEAIEKRSV